MQSSQYLRWLKAVGVAVAVFTLVSLLIGRFWWPSESGNWEKSLRMFSCLSLLLLAGELFIQRARLKSVPFVLFLLFLGGLLANAIATDSPSSVKQLLLILVFTLMVMTLGGEDSRLWRLVLGVAALSGAAFAGFSMLHKAALGQFVLAYRAMYIHDSGVPGVADFGITIEAGMHYAFSFLVAIWLMMRSRRIPVVLLWFACALIQGAYLYFTFSRAAWGVALFGGLLLLLSLSRGRVRLASVGALAVGGLAVLAVGYRHIAYEFADRGLTNRDQVWRAVINRIGEHWWFGHGSHTDLGEVFLTTGEVVHNPHSLYLEVLYQFGGVGLASLLVIFAATLWALWNCRDSLARLWFAMLASAAIVFAVEMHFFVAAPNVVWMWFWVPMAGALAVIGQHRSDRPRARQLPVLGAHPA